MSDYMIRELNATTGEEIDRPATAQEVKQFENDRLALEAEKKAEALRQAKKAELLAKLGITEDEARLLLS